MAVEDFEDSEALMEEKRTRKRRRLQRKLTLHQKVEVRSDEEGFLGSWHAGIVTACDETGQRTVQYDHLLTEDGSRNLVEVVRVLPALDGVGSVSNQSFHRGNIRPSPPPPIRFQNWGLHYGLCVDAFFKGSWWEGVIFDHDNGSPVRVVFFPEMGDEMRYGVDELRITQDWDALSETWTQRGNWVFLELLEECERDGRLPVSVKQIWYDLRASRGFKKVKEWTCPARNLWKKMVSEVVDEYWRISAKAVSWALAETGKELVDSDGFLPVDEPMDVDVLIDRGPIENDALESVRPGSDVDISPEAEMNNCRAIVPTDNSLSSGRLIDNGVAVKNSGEFSGRVTVDSLTISPSDASPEPDLDQLASIANCDASIVIRLTDSNISQHKQALRVLPQVLPNLPSNHDESRASSVSHGVKDILRSSTTDINGKSVRRAGRNTIKWEPFTSEMLPMAEFCPNAVHEYYNNVQIRNHRKPESGSLRENLMKHLLYLRWEFYFECENMTRKRYKSPDGKFFYSLFQVCKHLMESPGDMLSSGAKDDPIRLDVLPTESLPPEQLQQSQDPDCCPQTAVFSSCTKDAKPDQCSHPVMEYYQLVREGSRQRVAGRLISKAKKQLSAARWQTKVYYYPDTGRRVAYYMSPTGKAYKTLRTACEGYLKEESYKNSVSSRRPAKCINFAGESEIGLNFRDSLVQPTTPSKMLSGESSNDAKLSKFLEVEKVMVRGVRRNRKKRNGFLNDAEHVFQTQIKLCERRDRLRNGPKKHGKPNIQKDHISRLLKVKTTKKSQAMISSRYRKNHKRPKRVLTSSKSVREVDILNSTHCSPRSILSWLIDNNKVLPRAKVYYLRRTDQQFLAEGRITRDGVKCNCCAKVFSLSGFEVHAGSSCLKPSANIVLEDGKSLLDCQKEIIHDLKMQSSELESVSGVKSKWCRSENDYICSVCNYGGELMLCDRCPSSFHKTCLGLEDIPAGDWFCPSCCCGICGESKLQEEKEETKDGRILTCSQCERNYHFGCLRNRQPSEPDSYHMENWFCNEMCEKIFFNLQKLLGKSVNVGGESGENLTWSLLKSTKTDTGCATDIDALTENSSKLNVALGVMHECFEPVKDAHTRRDLMEDILFNRRSDLKRLDFQGFYTVLLARNDELISVATVRVYGQKVAEVPLVGTRLQYRRRGMCRILMNELEKTLTELGVERLVLPAVPGVLDTWTTAFGFSEMTASERLQFLGYTFLDFQDTIMCQKQLKIPSAELISPSRGVGLKFHDEICQNGDNIDFYRSSAGSEVNQADQTEDGRVTDLVQVESSAVHNSDNIVSLVEPRQNRLEGGPCQDFNTKDATLKRPSCNIDFFDKCYKRRKKSASDRCLVDDC